MPAYFYAGVDTERLGEGNIELTVTETGGATDTVSLSGRFFQIHEVDAVVTGEAWLPLYSELEAALAASALDATYSVQFDQSTGRWTISASGGGVTATQIAWGNTFTRKLFGFDTTVSGSLSHTSIKKGWYQMIAENGGITEWSEFYEVDDDLQEDLIAYDGSTAEGLARPGAIRGWDLEVPWESRAAIWRDAASVTTSLPFTWEDWFPHVRKGHPFIVQVPGLTAAGPPGVDRQGGIVAYPSRRRCAFRPKLAGGGYLGHANIPLGGYAIGVAVPP